MGTLPDFTFNNPKTGSNDTGQGRGSLCVWCGTPMGVRTTKKYCLPRCKAQHQKYRCSELEYRQRGWHLLDKAEDVQDAEPLTSLEVDGYTLPNKKAANLFKKFKNRKITLGAFAPRDKLDSLASSSSQPKEHGGELSAASARRSIPIDFDTPGEQIQDEFPSALYRKFFGSLSRPEQKVLWPVLFRKWPESPFRKTSAAKPESKKEP